MTLGAVGGAAGAWLILAMVLGIGELAAPGIFLVFLAIAAAITGVSLFALPDLPVAGQIASFAVWSVVAVLIGRRWYRDYPVPAVDPLLNDRAARLVGEIVIVEVPAVNGEGRVRVADGTWRAKGELVEVGERVRIVAVDNGVLVVEPLPPFTSPRA